MNKKTLRICPNGHHYYKSSNCPVCPTCEQIRNTGNGFLSLLSAPARRALENAGIITLPQLSKHTEAELLKLHGFGKASLPILKKALQEAGMTFNNAV